MKGNFITHLYCISEFLGTCKTKDNSEAIVTDGEKPTYLYLNNKYHLHHQFGLAARSSLILSNDKIPHRPSLNIGLLDDIQCPHRTDVCNFLRVGRHKHAHV